MSRRRRVRAAGPVFGAVAGVALALATLGSASRASVTFSFTRLAGSDRYATARVIATSSFSSSTTVLLATGEGFADALAGAYGAGAIQSPILLTPSASLSPDTTAALQSLKTKDIAILGGTDAIGANVQQQLDGMGYSTGRIAGADRYATARLIADYSAGAGIGTVGGEPTAIIASGEDPHFPDALSASPMSYADHLPILLTTTATLAPSAQGGLTDLGIKHVLVIGGTAAVSASVVSQIQGMGISTERLAGADRTDTAAVVADFELSKLRFSPAHVNLARGDLFPDSLSGGPHAGEESSPIVLTEDPVTLGQPTTNWLTAHATPLENGHVFGGTGAVSDAVVAEAQHAVQSNSSVSVPTTAATTTSTTGPPPAPMRLVAAHATAGSTALTVTYSQQAVCASVSSDGSDYIVSIVGGPHIGTTITVSGASCSGTLNQTVAITSAVGTPDFSAGDVVKIRTQTGSNGFAVTDAVAQSDPQGDAIQTTA